MGGRFLTVLTALAFSLSGCGFSLSAGDKTGPVIESGNFDPGAFVIAPVSTFEPLPCDETSVADGEICLVLGQSWLNENAIEFATVGASTFGGFTVSPVLTEDGIEAFNQIAGRCFSQTDDCATGMVAVIDNGVLLSAPTINAQRFDRDQLVIAGDFTEEEARALVEALND